MIDSESVLALNHMVSVSESFKHSYTSSSLMTSTLFKLLPVMSASLQAVTYGWVLAG